MAFIPVRLQRDGIVPWEKIPCSAIATEVGELMKMSSGKLAKASGTDAPEYVCMEKNAAAVAAGTPVHVIRVTNDMEFETVFSASAAAINIGDKVTVATDGLRVTATTTSGVAEVISMAGTASGDKCTVRF